MVIVRDPDGMIIPAATATPAVKVQKGFAVIDCIDGRQHKSSTHGRTMSAGLCWVDLEKRQQLLSMCSTEAGTLLCEMCNPSLMQRNGNTDMFRRGRPVHEDCVIVDKSGLTEMF